MAWNAAPTEFMTGWSEDGTNITVPIASFPEMTAAEADADTGDIRKVLLAMCEQWYSVYNALATADKSTKMVLSRAQTFAAGNEITRSYTMRFTIEPTTIEVVDE